MSSEKREAVPTAAKFSGQARGIHSGTVVAGVSAALTAFLLGYLVTVSTAIGSVQAVARGFATLAEAGVALAPEWKLAVWTYLDAHLVGTVLPSGRVNLVEIAGVEYLYLVAPLVIVLAGGVAAYYHGAQTVRNAAMAGATVAVGYVLIAAAAGLFSGYANIAPASLRLVVFVGVLYPVLFGALGGVLYALGSQKRPDAN